MLINVYFKINFVNFNDYCVENNYCRNLKVKYRYFRKKYRTKFFELITEIPFQIKNYSDQHPFSEEKPKTIIVSHYTLNNGYIKSVIKNHRAYAKLHGYDYWFRNGIIDGNFLDLNTSGEVKATVYALFWQKLAAVKQAMDLMEGSQRKYQWIMWIDGDAVFTNLEQTIEKLRSNIGVEDNDYLLIARDLSCNEKKICFVKACLNSGVFLIKNNQEGRNFIEKVIASFEIYYDHVFPEQVAMEDLIFGINTPSHRYSFLIKKEFKNYNKCELSSVSGVKIVDPKVMNSGYNNRKNPFGCWQNGDFIAHFAGNKQRDKLIPKFLNCIKDNYTKKQIDLCKDL